MLTPDLETFARLARPGDRIPIFREILADRLTPVSAFERLQQTGGEEAERYSFLLESVERGERLGRYSFLGINPSLVLRCRGSKAWTLENHRWIESDIPAGADPLTLLKELMGRRRYISSKQLPRFSGGAVGFFGYDVVRFFEKLPDDNPDPLQVDDACFLFTDTLLIFDHLRHRIQVVCNVDVDEDAAAAYRAGADRIDNLVDAMRRPFAPPGPRHTSAKVNVEHLFARQEFLEAVKRCREYILAGDAFQIVLSQRFRVDFSCQPFDLYRALRSVNPSPYMYYLETGRRKIVGTSPEILVTVSGGRVCLRPIAGTRPRGATPDADAALEVELLADEKERAEHIMLVDLARNDVGRVAAYGTVKLDELMVIERYSHVMHIVSNVTGAIAEGRDVFDVLRASFPAGTVSGAPKVRAMEIIDEQEPLRRGFYAGALGYFSYTGDMDMAITIRTMLVDGQTAYLQAGAGLVADAIPENEYQECLNKAGALMTAIELAEAGLD